jgi:hypothetical protein
MGHPASPCRNARLIEARSATPRSNNPRPLEGPPATNSTRPPFPCSTTVRHSPTSSSRSRSRPGTSHRSYSARRISVSVLLRSGWYTSATGTRRSAASNGPSDTRTRAPTGAAAAVDKDAARSRDGRPSQPGLIEPEAETSPRDCRLDDTYRRESNDLWRRKCPITGRRAPASSAGRQTVRPCLRADAISRAAKPHRPLRALPAPESCASWRRLPTCRRPPSSTAPTSSGASAPS